MMLSPQIANLGKPTLQPKSPDEEPSESDDLQAKEFAAGDPSPFKSQLARSARLGHYFQQISLSPIEY